ncbi:MAG: HNH endonuclease [Paludibacter sp.]|nr:HNH endonuclease [Paludibacter sp.]
MNIAVNTLYLNKEWLDKRDLILKRDNYTCQGCQTFNPSLGSVELSNPIDNSLEIHFYRSTPGSSVYTISSEKYKLDVEIDFGRNWMVLPVLQVHHKRYIQNKNLWDYDDTDLITLCKNCHNSLHDNFEIPICDSSGLIIKNKKFTPKDEGCGGYHTYDPWTFIYLNREKEYLLKDIIKPFIRLIVTEEEDSRIEEIREIAKTMYLDFFKRYIPNYTNQSSASAGL